MTKTTRPENASVQDATGSGGNSALLPSPEHVLSTLENDGSRRWLKPKLSTGELWSRRRIVAYLLMVVFVVVPHLRINGKPLILLDIAAREFTILGRTFLPTDTLLLALLMLTVFLTVVLVTAVTGRAWCGWGCPQTVYMEFLFRPVDRLFNGTVGKGGKPKQAMPGWKHALRLLVYLFLCMFLAHTFLAYFVGTEQLARWVRSSPLEHPTAFLVMGATTGLMLFDFLFFREQMCLIACPYGRFQSVMLDQQSMIVAYDHVRGEPRKKGKHHSGDDAGDCVDCNQCVVVCPTGIDIRDGLQMECINCTQCIDACNTVMDRVGCDRGLIRFSSQDGIERKPKRLLRARTIVYPILLAIVASGLVFAIWTKSGFDARVLREKGAPFTQLRRGEITNMWRMRLVNRTDQTQNYSLAIIEPNDVELDFPDEAELTIEAGETARVPFSVRFPASLTFGDGNESVRMKVSDESGNQREIQFSVVGPRQ